MVKIFIIFLIVILVFAAVIGLAVMMRGRNYPDDIDKQYYDEGGNHAYYDRSRIEKEEFMRENPGAKPQIIKTTVFKKTVN